MRRFILAFAALALLAGCATKEEIPRTDAEIAQSVYRHGGQPALTLLTMVNNRNGSGAHTALMINGSQRVIFDPAGSFRNQKIIRRNDVIYGVNDNLLDVYTRYHARKTYHVQIQRLPVSAELAEAVMRAAMQVGPVPDALCASSTSELLANFPQFGIKQTWYPNDLAEQFGRIQGVTSRKVIENDSDDNKGQLRDYDPKRDRIATEG